jgi:hypothetical protein
MSLLGGRELGDSLGTFRDSVLGKFSGEDETNGSLNLAGRDGRLLVVRGKLGGFTGDPFARDREAKGISSRTHWR